MFGVGVQELLIILVIVIIVFGASRLPQLGDGLGKMISNYKNATKPPESVENKSDKDSKSISG